MFRRKEDENSPDSATEEGNPTTTSTTSTSESSGSSSAPVSSSSAPLTATPHSASPVTASRPVTEAPRPAATAASFRPTPPSARMVDAPRSPLTASTPVSSASADKQASKGGRRILTVGNDILLKGEIATCDRLVIEGKVDATLNDVHTVEIAETGSFKGSAAIEDAEISGLFEGELVVKNRLVIYSTGKVRGKITYGEIEIERGGELTGEIKMGAGAANKQTKAA